MALSFTMSPGPSAVSSRTGRRVMVTGAAGRIGRAFAEATREKYALRLMVRGDEAEIEKIRPLGEVVTANLSDLARLKEICRGIDTVLHLAANPDPSAVWSALLPDNIVGTYNLMTAAKSAGVRRVIYASSIHAVGGYPREMQVKTDEPVNPGDLYGVTKCFGEALGRYMAEQEGLSVIAIRIGAFLSGEGMKADSSIAPAEMFVSPPDLVDLISRCIDVENLKWAVFHGISNNRFKRLDISDARELLGYSPHDDFAYLHPKFKELTQNQPISAGGLGDSGQRSGLRDDL